ncbi:hypothetical protein BJX61DRAFT_544649 [Aspergillus egyptiacus]|nr:hypothetical protein BJX61DRAFT_544649 [Aspergillus egyptiacus]
MAPAVTQSQALILRLPQEILDQILEYAVEYMEWRMKKIALVCRDFYATATPLLYRYIRLTLFDTHLAHPIINELNAPLYRDHCRVMRLEIYEDCGLAAEEDVTRLADLVSSTPKLRSLDIWCCGRLVNTWRIMKHAMSHMPLLRNLKFDYEFNWLASYRNRVYVDAEELVAAALDTPSLRTLEIHGAGFYNNPFGEEDELRLYRTASFTSLSLMNILDAPHPVIQPILQLSRSLTHFAINVYRSSFPQGLNIKTLGEYLSIYKDTLETLSIGIVEPGTVMAPMIDVSPFTNLKTLTLDLQQLYNPRDRLPWHPQAADRLLAPRLETLRLSFHLYRESACFYTRFGPDERNWVRQLAIAAFQRKAALKTIEIQDYHPRPQDFGADDEYPWTYFNSLPDEIAPLGINLLSEEPTVSEEEWRIRVEGTFPRVFYKDAMEYENYIFWDRQWWWPLMMICPASPEREDAAALVKLLSNIPRVEYLHLVRNYWYIEEAHLRPGPLWTAIRETFRHMPALKTFCLDDRFGSPPDIVKIADCLPPSAQTLMINRLRSYSSSSPEALEAREAEGTGNLTSLSLTHVRDEDCTIDTVIKWPKALVHFSLVGYRSMSVRLDLPTLINWLSVHKKTLQTINIAILPRHPGRGLLPDLSPFTALRTLTLSVVQLRPVNDKNVVQDIPVPGTRNPHASASLPTSTPST